MPALQKILGHADLKMVLRYSYLAPEYLRQEIEKTERRASAHGSTQRDVGADTLERLPWKVLTLLVPKGGLEPPHPCGHMTLNR